MHEPRTKAPRPAPRTQSQPASTAMSCLRSRPAQALHRHIGNQTLQRLIQSEGIFGSAPAAAPAGLPSSVAKALAGHGEPLPSHTRESAESFFGTDLGPIRVHTGDAAAQANAALNARAFSAGQDIALRNRADLADRRLIGHELAHALQPAAPANAKPVSSPHDPAEREAHAAAEGFAGGHAGGYARVPLRASRAALVQRDPRHPSATVFDADYLLYSLDGTDYDGETQHYYLSPWDRAHLRRLHGLYFLQTRRLHLIGPPEVRRAAGSRGVLIEVSAAELASLARVGRSGAAQFAIDKARRALNVTVSSVTLSRGADQDFSVPDLPAGVARALGSPLEGVSAGERAGVDAARIHAASVQQERTLSLADVRSEELPIRELAWRERMDVNTLFGRDEAGRAGWYVERLAAFQAQLLESAHAHRLPMQLLAAVILNELADINAADIVQSGPSTFRGSLGIAQIQIDTARRDRLVDLPHGAHRTGWARSGGHAHDIDHPAMVDMGERLRTGQLLQVPQIAIEAAAREVELLLDRMAANRSRPWQVDHEFNATGAQGDAIYAHVGSGAMANREARLADAVCGAYNSPDVITASDTSRFSNARIHGSNAYALAQDLYRFRLFRGQ